MMFWGERADDDFENEKTKNVRQTEILVDLREAILQVARHFQSLDPKNCKIVISNFFSPFATESNFKSISFQSLQADYLMESHAKDLENFVNVSRKRRKRAKALLDFERHDDDELGFKKNDIITVRCYV